MHHVERHPYGGLRTTLRVAGLQHVQFAALDRELEVLHVAVMALEPLCDLRKLAVDGRLIALEVGDLAGGADPCDDVLALRVREILAEQLTLAGIGIAGERDAGSRVVAHVAEHHRDDVHRRSPIVGDLVVAAIVDGALGMPRVEDGLNRAVQLHVDVLRERLVGLALDQRLEARDHVAPRRGVELRVGRDPAGTLRVGNDVFEAILRQVEHDARIHRDEAPVCVPREALVAGQFCESRDRLVVEPQVEDRVHHARHRRTRAAAHGDEQRIGCAAEGLAGHALEFAHLGRDRRVEAVGEATSEPIELEARFGRDREAGRHRQAGARHLGEPRALAAEQFLHRAIALGEAPHALGRTG